MKSYGKMSEGKIKCIYSSHIFPQRDTSSENNIKHFMPSALVVDTFTTHVNMEYSFSSYASKYISYAYSSKHLKRAIYKNSQPLIFGSLSSTLSLGDGVYSSCCHSQLYANKILLRKFVSI